MPLSERVRPRLGTEALALLPAVLLRTGWSCSAPGAQGEEVVGACWPASQASYWFVWNFLPWASKGEVLGMSTEACAGPRVATP
eukprot:15116692-Heterocapsa_arctica.AAC.1